MKKSLKISIPSTSEPLKKNPTITTGFSKAGCQNSLFCLKSNKCSLSSSVVAYCMTTSSWVTLAHHLVVISTNSYTLSLEYMATPANTFLRWGWSRRTNSVTTPKLHPPPRIPQNKSGFSSSFAVFTLPSARTTVACTTRKCFYQVDKEGSPNLLEVIENHPMPAR